MFWINTPEKEIKLIRLKAEIVEISRKFSVKNKADTWIAKNKDNSFMVFIVYWLIVNGKTLSYK